MSASAKRIEILKPPEFVEQSLYEIRKKIYPRAEIRVEALGDERLVVLERSIFLVR